MSGTTPGQGAAEDAPHPTPDPPHPEQQDRSAMRTSLAERFAAAKGVAEHPVVPRPDATAPVDTEPAPVRPGTSGGSGGSAPAPRHGATARTARPPPAPPQSPPRPAGQQGAPAPPQGARPGTSGPRRVRLSVARVDPWSVMKLSFLLSIAVGIGIVVA